MRGYTDGRCRSQISFLRRQFLQEGELPFSDVLSKELVSECARDLGRRLEGPGLHAAGDAVGVPRSGAQRGSLLSRGGRSAHRSSPLGRARRVLLRRPAPTARPGTRLPEEFFSAVTRSVGAALDSRAHPEWLWKGRRVLMFDGATVSMPDTPANQAEYPQPYNQRPGLGFPLARIGAITSLATGAILDLGFRRYAGKGQGEVTLLRGLYGVFRSRRRALGGLPDRQLAVSLRDTAAGRGHGHSAQQGPADSRLPPRSPAREGGPPGALAKAPHPRRGSQGAAGDAEVPDGPRGCGSAYPATRLPHQGDHPRHDAARSEAVSQGRPRRTVPGALEPRARPAVDQDDDADGRAALQDARAGAQRSLDPPAGVQPDPHGHGPSRRESTASRPAR